MIYGIVGAQITRRILVWDDIENYCRSDIENFYRLSSDPYNL